MRPYNIQEKIPSWSARCRRRAWGGIEYSRAPATQAKYQPAPDKSVLISYSFAKTSESIALALQDQIPLRIIPQESCQLRDQTSAVIRCHSGVYMGASFVRPRRQPEAKGTGYEAHAGIQKVTPD